MAQVLLTGENRFLSPRDFKELGVAKRSRSTTSARSALQQPWSIIGRTNFLKAATNLNLCRCSLPHLVRVRSVRDHHTRRQSHTASMDELACSEFMFWRSCLRLPHSRLGYPRSGLSRSDLVLWAQSGGPGMSALAPLSGDKRTSRNWVQNDANDPFETSGRLAFFGSFVNIVRMTVVVITFANLWWRST